MSYEELSRRIDQLTNDLHHHTLRFERRVTRLEILITSQFILLLITLVRLLAT
jgi:hypothetical protein